MQSFRLQKDKSYTFRTQTFSHISPGREKLIHITHEPIVINLLTVGIIALSVLLLAIFNYINLTLARSLSRGREVGVRKIIGAKRSQLVYQFLLESVLSMLLSLALAYGIFQQIKQLSVVERITGEVQWDASLWLICMGFSLIVGMLAGIIPARVLSAFGPVQALKSENRINLLKGLKLRKVLTVAQFSASLVALVFILVLYRQTSYMATASYGFNQKNILNIPLQGQSYGLLAQAFASQAGVERVSATSTLLGMRAKGQMVWRKRMAATSGTDAVTTFTYAVDTNFVSIMGLTLLSGRNLQIADRDSTKPFVLVNEEAIRIFGLGDPSQAIGQTLWLNDSTEIQIAGVIKDFRYQSFLFPMAPLMLRYQPDAFNYMNVKVANTISDNIIPALERVWKRINPYQPFYAEWFEQQLYEQNFQREDQLFMGMLTGMALSIACLGLLGIVMYSTQTRTKEVAIRKVVGASIGEIVLLLSKEFIGLLLIAGVIGLPLGYYVASLFIQQYAYHITIGFGTLIICFILLLVLGGLAIGSQTVRAALTNPARSLRTK
jgi:putative ABC transport system permease protein